MMKKLDVFRIPIYTFENVSHDKYAAEWIKFNNEYDRYIESPQKTVKLSLPNLHRSKLFEPLTTFFRESLAKVVEDMGWSFDIDIVSMWSTIQGMNGQHHIHTHNNCMFVGTYYLHSDTSSTPGTTFYNVMSDFRVFKVSGLYGGREYGSQEKSSTTWYDSSHVIPFEAGKLVIYPGWMRHGGRAHNGKNRQIVAFNAMPIGQTDEDPLNRYMYTDFREDKYPYDEE